MVSNCRIPFAERAAESPGSSGRGLSLRLAYEFERWQVASNDAVLPRQDWPRRSSRAFGGQLRSETLRT